MAAERQSKRVSRRAALRTSTAVGVAGVGLAVGATGRGLGPGRAAASAGGSFAVDGVIDPAVSIVRAGSGPPQRGDFFYTSARLFQVDKTDGPQIGVYQCFGAWTAASTETDAPDQRLTSVQFRLDGVGAIMGIINEGGAAGNAHVGALQGGTGAFTGVLGTFRQELLSGPLPGIAPGQAVFRAHFTLM